MDSLGRQVKKARLDAGQSQSALAQAVGCKQSAISMFEGGQSTALTQETLGKIEAVLGVKFDRAAVVATAPAHRHYCPNAECPSNVPVVVGDELRFVPRRSEGAVGKFCPWCGEILESRCPECGAPLNSGPICASCGTAYVTSGRSYSDIAAYARARRAELAEVDQLL